MVLICVKVKRSLATRNVEPFRWLTLNHPKLPIQHNVVQHLTPSQRHRWKPGDFDPGQSQLALFQLRLDLVPPPSAAKRIRGVHKTPAHPQHGTVICIMICVCVRSVQNFR